MILLPLSLALGAFANPPQQEPPVKDLVQVHLRGRDEMFTLRRIARDFDDHQPPTEDGRVVLYADDSEQHRLRDLGFQLEVVQEDLSAFYAARAAQDPAARASGGSMGGFKTLAEINAEMDALATAYPGVVSPKFSVGTSWEGRTIWAMRVSDNPTVDEPAEANVWFDALHHAREPMSGESLLLLAEHLGANYGVDEDVSRMVDTRDILIIPCVNPDGYEYNRQTNPNGGGMWRKNRRDNGGGTWGVDLNRNYDWQWGPGWGGSSGSPGSDTYRGPAPFSEPETAAMRDHLLVHEPVTAITAHTYSNLWLWPWGYDEIYTPDEDVFSHYGDQLAATNGWPAGTIWEVLYVANGDAGDYHYGQHGAWSISPEIGSGSDGFWPSPSRIGPLWDAVRPGYLMMTEWAGAWLEIEEPVWTEVSGDGDADLEAGETWQLDLELFNDGSLAGAGTAQLFSNSAEIVVDVDLADFDVGERASGLAGPLQVTIQSSAQSGVAYDLDVVLDYDGATSTESLTLRLGSQRLLGHDDMELAGLGWETTTTASHYGFERADPQQTSDGGTTVQPGTDNPEGSGTHCWVTGASAGSSAGTNDVDGTTTLTSPRFRVSGFEHLRLEYARWFANLPGNELDDEMLVEVSNDDGQSWSTLEITGNANAWTTVGFDLETVLPLSDTMRLRVTVADDPNNDLTEGLIDDLVLSTVSELPSLGSWGRLAPGTTVKVFVDGASNVSYRIQYSLTAGPGTSVGGVDGLFYLTGNVRELLSGSLDVNGEAEIVTSVPNNASLSGRTIHLQALVDENGAQAAYSNLLTVVIE